VWSLPDLGEAFHEHQTILFQEYLDVLIAGLAGIDCVLSGCDVTAQGAPNMTVAVAKGAVISNGVLRAVTAGNVTIAAADATNPRIDLVVVTSAGAKAARAGTPAAEPKPPIRSANDVVLAAVYVAAADTTIENDKITGLRVMRGGVSSGGGSSILLKKVTTPVVINTNNTIQTLFTLTIPAGLFAPGQIIRVRMGGTLLANSGTPTWTWTISYGGTTMFADVSTGFAADTDRRAWRLEFDLIAQGATFTDQALNGSINYGSTAVVTAPATGVGDILAPAAIGNVQTSAAFNGAAAVDSDAADRDLLVRVTMSVSNVAVETAMEFASAELV
jgi:hypothetical protein